MPSDQTKPTRGGARPGAGRKPLAAAEKIAARKALDSCRKMVRLTPDEVDAVKSAAQHAGITPHAWMVRAVRDALRRLSLPN